MISNVIGFIGIGILLLYHKWNILQPNQYMKPNKVLYFIHAGIESLIKKIDECASYLQKYSTPKIGKHIISGDSISIKWVFHNIENKHSLYCEEYIWKSIVLL